jgi:hypothetical protein
MPASSLREEAQATVSTKHGHRGEHEVSRKTIARGMPGDSGVTVVTMLVCFFHCTRGCGRIVRPAFPAPSDFWADVFCKTSDASRREIAKSYFEIGVPSLRGATRRSNPFFFDATPWIASRSLSSGARSRDPLARNDGFGIGCLKR